MIFILCEVRTLRATDKAINPLLTWQPLNLNCWVLEWGCRSMIKRVNAVSHSNSSSNCCVYKLQSLWGKTEAHAGNPKWMRLSDKEERFNSNFCLQFKSWVKDSGCGDVGLIRLSIHNRCFFFFFSLVLELPHFIWHKIRLLNECTGGKKHTKSKIISALCWDNYSIMDKLWLMSSQELYNSDNIQQFDTLETTRHLQNC